MRHLPAAPAAGGDARAGLRVGSPIPGLDGPAYGEPMSDFDAALERLLTDPAFAAALAADPDRALAGYRLDGAESELLRSQVVADTSAATAAVEARTTKSSTFGLFSSIGDLAGGAAAGVVGAVGDPGASQGLGSAPPARGGGGGTADAARSGLGDAPRSGLGGPGHGAAEGRTLPAPEGYRNKVDADGDGTWDRATYRGRADGGVDIVVDLNADGRADFVGHDVDKDRVVDSADYDKDHDGVFEKRMYDDDGDGWLDRTVRRD